MKNSTVSLYNKVYKELFESEQIISNIERAAYALKSAPKIFFIGNGGSNAICSHMMEDFAKILGLRTFSFSDASLITCFSNDYGYDKAIEEWLKIHIEPGDYVVAISSSGNSPNIINAAEFSLGLKAHLISLSGFSPNNMLNQLGEIRFHVGIENYGIVECFHQIILHMILDIINES